MRRRDDYQGPFGHARHSRLERSAIEGDFIGDPSQHSVIQPLMSNVAAPWILYMVGAIIALLMTWLKISPLAFALGMYIPLELNTPLLAGGLVAWYVSSRSKNEKLNNARFSRGTLIASGFIAGGSLFGVIGAFLRFGGINLFNTEWSETRGAELIGIMVFLLLAVYILWDSLRAREE